MSDLISRQAAIDAITSDINYLQREIDKCKSDPSKYTDNFKLLMTSRLDGLLDAQQNIESLPSKITEYKTFCGVPIKEAARIVQEYNAYKPTGDSISRQAALDSISYDVADTYDRIKSLPSAGPRIWIPVSEKLPDIDTPVIICTAGGGITDGYRWNEKDWFLAWGDYNGRHGDSSEGRIIAWMPLPEPYRE